ncbi:adenine phosphoribosyltransferase [Clostridiales bacterium PH28_bin88]|nr:adenine phosphoribosyltransferase [Clostridiales bacterium PH28_bin88]
MNIEELKAKIRVIPDFPGPGISFKDITTLIKDGDAFRFAVRELANKVGNKDIELVVAPEARGFLVGIALAYELGLGFIPVRKKGKLPAGTYQGEYQLEYGTDVLEMHRDAVQPGQKVLVVDDLLATGGTVSAAIGLVERAGGIVEAVAFLIELTYLPGRKQLEKYDVVSLIKY